MADPIELVPETREGAAGYYQCPYCPYGSFNKDYAVAHLSDHRTQAAVSESGGAGEYYQCPNCSYGSFNKAYVTAHLNDHHAQAVFEKRFPNYVPPAGSEGTQTYVPPAPVIPTEEEE
jgi:DNA-directed RNA polymerase subunit RPC12/RpoP